ncbi:hypothetical protein DFR47_11539 [Pseudochrobactrum asaccharolyticum]|uniref:Uncharacterized protein n=1 Tax=Pseudochrobactrum asaccharolyticum TaxID=354351 RepID=A0A366DHV8_9HYPH|nr:hypothetical protein DFR47_11539 [Pseudochrobactrum asaccharolyticum]
MTTLEILSLLIMPAAGLILAGAAVYFANHIR